MEFSPRGFQRNNAPRPATNANSSSDGDKPTGGGSGDPNPDRRSSFKKGVDKLKTSKAFNTLSVVLFASLLVLSIAVIFAISSFGNKELRAVDDDNYQAVVLADGQAYFGKITDINNDYLTLHDVFYVQGQQLDGTGSSQGQTAARLLKLGCEIHGPQDRMTIYRTQVTYWENLKPDGRVPQLIQQFKSENPDGQTCSTQQQSTQTPSQGTEPAQQDNTGGSEQSTGDTDTDTGSQDDTTTSPSGTENDTTGTGTETETTQ